MMKLVAIIVALSVPALARLNLTPELPPCREGQTHGCTPRVVPCGTVSEGAYDLKIDPTTNTRCGTPQGRIDPYRHQNVLVQFNDSKGVCREILMRPGECWGTDYNCMGRCGAGCGTWSCSNWAADCLRHDVCSYYFTASGGSNDPNCGFDFDLAIDDFIRICAVPWRTACEASDSSIRGSSFNAICQ